MHRIRLIIALAGLFFVLAPAAPAEEARTLLDRAIQAHGGEARLERAKKGHLKAEFKGKQLNGVFLATWEETFDLPARYRRTIEGTVQGSPFHSDGAMNGLKGWLREGSAAPADISADELVPLEEHWYAIVAQLLLFRGKDIQLTSLADETRNGRTFAGLRAVSPRAAAYPHFDPIRGLGQPRGGAGSPRAATDLYFDKSTRLLARARQTTPNLPRGQEQSGETVYEDYREIQGIRYPMRFQAGDGKTFSLTIQLSSIEFLDAIDDGVFAKPETPAAAEPSPPASASNEEKPTRWLIVATLSAVVVVGAMWYLVRASKRGKQETPSS